MNYVAFFTFVVITTYTPGPNNIMSMAIGNRLGFKNVIPFTLGVGMGFAVLLGLSMFFNSALSNFIPKYGIYMRIVGASYILYLAYHFLKDQGDIKEEKKLLGFKEAFFLQAVNPKGVLYALTVTSTFILPYFESIYSRIAMMLLLGLISISSTMLWAAFGSVFKTFMEKHQRVFNYIMALLLVYVAWSLLFH